MVRGVRSAVRTSWRTLTLAAALGIALPMAASAAGAAAAGPIPLPSVVAAAAATRPGAARSSPRTAVLAAEGHHRRHQTTTPVHAGWDLASLLVDVPSRGITAHRSPWSTSPSAGTVAARSKYYRVPLVIWVEETNANGTWGRVELPYVWPRVDGWIPLDGLTREQTFLHVDVDLSEHRVRVYKRNVLLFTVQGATGTASSPTPPGRYVVTDRVPFSPGSALGSFAFGISGIQPHLPAGWSGGNQLAIHGTNDPSSIGTNASAGCVRVSEWALDRLEPLLRLGTPVLIHA